MALDEILVSSYKPKHFQGTVGDFLLSKFPNKRTVVIGIEGASGSGKTSFTSSLLTQITETKAAHISLDDYVHLTKEEMTVQGIETRYDWRSRNREKFLRDISDLRAGKVITKPIQDYALEKPSDKKETVLPKQFILVEGNLDISDICDFTIFLFAPDNILIERRLKRDENKYIHTDKQVLLSWIHESLGYYHQYLEPKADRSDFIINTDMGVVYEKRT